MSRIIAPPGWSRDATATRFADGVGTPRTFDRESRAVTAVLSKGAKVARPYGAERLRIAPDAIDLSRIDRAAIPVLDSHQQTGIDHILGRLQNAWIERGALVGRIEFSRTKRGDAAMEMVARGELSSLSIGYTVQRWQAFDVEGSPIDPAKHIIGFGDDETIFEASRWTLLECSLVSVPADPEAAIRSFGTRDERARRAREARARMLARQRMLDRMRYMRRPL